MHNKLMWSDGTPSEEVEEEEEMKEKVVADLQTLPMLNDDTP